MHLKIVFFGLFCCVLSFFVIYYLFFLLKNS